MHYFSGKGCSESLESMHYCIGILKNLSQIREELGTLSFPDVSKQALSKARQFINPSLFKELYYLSVDLFYSQIPSRKL